MAAQIFNLGKLRFTYKGVFDAFDEYQLNDVVKYQNNLYVYVNTGATTGNTPTNTTFWSKMIDGYTDPTSGTNGQFLKTTGTAFAFESISQVPSQTSNSGKLLTTNGTAASWANELPQLDISGDFESSKTSGVTLVGAGARADYESLGASVKTASNKSLTSNVATITTSAAHGFSPFQFVTVALSPSDPVFDGTYEILATPTLNTFTYAKTNSNVSSSATVGTVSAIPGYTNAAAVFAIDADDDFAQVAFRNSGNGANSSTDLILYPDNGTDFSGYIDMGITSSNFNDPEFTITGPNDGYIFLTAPANTAGAGNLVIATGDLGSENKIIFAAGGLSSNNTQMSITPDVNVHIEIATASTSPTTGALTVVGGVGISGDVNIAGDIVFGGSGTTLTTTTLTVTDPIIRVGSNNSSDAVDLGFVGEYTAGGVTKYSGLVRDASDGVYKFYKDTTVAPASGVVNFAGSGLTYADIQVNNLTVAGITASGNLALTGGAVISGTTDVQELREQVVEVTLSSNSATLNWTAGNIFYIPTAPSAGMTLNINNVPTDTNKIMTVNVLVTQGSTGYGITTLQINGTNQTIRWANSSTPTFTNGAGKIDLVSLSLHRTSGGSWLVYGAVTVGF